MVGHIPLEDGIGVRVPVPQQWQIKTSAAKQVFLFGIFEKRLEPRAATREERVKVSRQACREASPCFHTAEL